MALTKLEGGAGQILGAAMRVGAGAQLGLLRVEQLLGGLSMAMLQPRAQAALTAHLYDLRGSYGVSGLFDWEAQWLADELPTAPSKILVGGAGSGREVGALLYDQHAVVAFDPARRYVESALKDLPSGDLLAYEVGGYEDLLSPEHPLAGTVAAHAPYDAVLLGWGSFTHVISAQDRQQVLRRLRSLCPTGPLLLSFWLRADEASTRRSRSFEAGWAFGSLLRGGVPHGPAADGVELHMRSGFGYRFLAQDIQDLAHGNGDELRLRPGAHQAYAHATFVPRSSRAAG